jgi:hypothetical protein
LKRATRFFISSREKPRLNSVSMDVLLLTRLTKQCVGTSGVIARG